MQTMNSNPSVQFKVKGREVREEFMNMLREFCKKDNRDRLWSETGDKLDEIGDLLSVIVEAINTMQEAKKLENQKEKEADKRKLDDGCRVLADTTGCLSKDAFYDVEDEKTDMDDDVTPWGRKWNRSFTQLFEKDGGLAEFGHTTRDVDLETVFLKQKKLDFEERRHLDVLKEHATERKAKEVNRQENLKNDIDRVKAMLNFAVTSICSKG